MSIGTAIKLHDYVVVMRDGAAAEQAHRCDQCGGKLFHSGMDDGSLYCGACIRYQKVV